MNLNAGKGQKLLINGGRRLEGRVKIHSAKNAILPILAATLLTSSTSVIEDCPRFSDVLSSVDIIKSLGGSAEFDGDNLVINTENVDNFRIPHNKTREMRSSVIFLGSLLARCGQARLGLPGGCEIGSRPIDLHLKAFKQMGVEIADRHDEIVCRATNLKNSDIHLNFPSVGATENVMLLAAGSNIKVRLTNPAKEPEIVDLQAFLNKAGAHIEGAGTNEILIQGTKRMRAVEHRSIPDRIVAATYLCAGAITGGDVTVSDVIPSDLQAILEVLRETGCEIDVRGDSVRLSAPRRLNSVDYICTMPHPGFPTDAQALMMSVLSVAHGASIFAENMFDNRYKHAEELTHMGADITLDGRLAVVRGLCSGVDGGGLGRLSGTRLEGRDLRGTAALIVAALNAQGVSEVYGLEHLYRGYIGLAEGLNSLGADIC